MFTSSMVLLLVTLTATSVGLMGVVWSRYGEGAARACWGRRLFFVVLGVLAVAALFAAWRPESGFLYAGLAVGGLLISMLWEGAETNGGQASSADAKLLIPSPDA